MAKTFANRFLMKILIVTTSADSLGADHPTGLWLEEFAVPFDAFSKAGATLVVASPKGGTVPIDPKTEPDDKQREKWAAALAALQHTERLADVAASDFDAMFVPGGHGPMIDLAHDPDVHRLLGEFERADKVIGAVCHGPAAFINAVGADGKPFVAGKRLSGFTDNEERLVRLDRVVPFLLESVLKERGAHFDGTPIPFAPHVVTDGNLITGQNPASSEEIAKRILEALHRPERV